MIKLALAAAITLFLGIWQVSFALTVKDSTIFGRGVFLVSWTDHMGKQRKAALVNSGDHTGISQYLSYYAGSTLVTATPGTPNADPLNSGFGSTCHHSATMYSGGTFTKRWQGASMVVFDWVQNIDGATETVTYTFMDGLYYFQWAETMNTAGGTSGGDSRGPYCTINWDGMGGPAEGVEYGARRYFKQPVLTGSGWPNRSGPYTFGDTCDIPYAWEWAHGREIGYVATQSFTQQNQGVPAWSEGLPASAATMDPNGDEVWKTDFQMNFYDQGMKITWGQPYGWTNNTGDAKVASCLKNGWGQYSLSIIFDATADGGVMRVRDENRLIHGAKVAFSASVGTVKTQGPIGTAHPAPETLSPAGYDHNYRSWWATAANNQVSLIFTVSEAGANITSPVFRVSGIDRTPTSITVNGMLMAPGKDCFVSYDVTNKEAWVTIPKPFSGNNTIVISAGPAQSIMPFLGDADHLRNKSPFMHLYDMNGRLIARRVPYDTDIQKALRMNRCRAGLYIVTPSSAGGEVSRGLVVRALAQKGGD